jgi:hypothetical protein
MKGWVMSDLFDARSVVAQLTEDRLSATKATGTGRVAPASVPAGTAPEAERARPVEQRGIVAYLDVLGTKGIPSGRAAVERALGIRGLHAYINSQVSGVNGRFRAAVLGVLRDSSVRSEGTIHQFSDSVFLWVPTRKRQEFSALSDLASVLIRTLHYGLRHRLPLRGGVSIGRFVADEGVILGEAVAEAVEWERVAEWSGVVLAPSATNPVIRELAQPRGLNRTREFAWADVPTKGSPIPSGTELMTLAWPNVDFPSLRGRIDEMYLSTPLPVEAAAKWIHTMEYFDEIARQLVQKEILPAYPSNQRIIRGIWKERSAGG